MRLFVILAFLFSLCGGVWFFHYTGTPEYTIARVQHAIVTHDLELAKEYVDLESVSGSIVDDVISKPVLSAFGPNVIARWAFSAMSGFYKSGIQSGVKQELVTYIESGGFSEATASPSGKDKSNTVAREAVQSAGLLSFLDSAVGLKQLQYKGVESTDLLKSSGTISLLMRDPTLKKDLVLTLKINKIDGKWIVTKVSNLDVVLGELIERKSEDVGKNLGEGESLTEVPSWQLAAFMQRWQLWALR